MIRKEITDKKAVKNNHMMIGETTIEIEIESTIITIAIVIITEVQAKKIRIEFKLIVEDTKKVMKKHDSIKIRNTQEIPQKKEDMIIETETKTSIES